MGTQDLIEAMAKETSLTRNQAQEAIDNLFGNMTASLQSEERVVITDFGIFNIDIRESRSGYNSKGELVEIPRKVKVHFKEQPALSKALNQP